MSVLSSAMGAQSIRTLWSTQQQGTILKLGIKPSSALILNFPASATVSNKFLSFKNYPVSGVLF